MSGSGARWAGCTIISPNYLAYARTVAASYVRWHPEQRFYVLIVADVREVELFGGGEFEAVSLWGIGLEDVRREGMRYDILELNTNVKPTFLKYLLGERGLERVVYLDPDIYVYGRLEPVWAALDEAEVVLTPHVTSPMVLDGKSPGEQDLLYNGTYNLGFIAVRGGDVGLRVLDWWEERCLRLGFSEGRTGLFVDQKWMNLVPGMFGGVAILRDVGCNMAYWNLGERRLGEGRLVNDAVPLRFFHFSGVAVDDSAMLSRNTDRFTLGDRPDLRELFGEYQREVVGRRDPVREGVAYGFDALSDGTAVTRLARRIYAAHEGRWAGEDPFDARGGFGRFAKRLGLVKGKARPAKATWREFDGADRRVAAVHRGLKMMLRVLGPDRYELLMRYLGHITVLRNQAVFLDDRRAGGRGGRREAG